MAERVAFGDCEIDPTKRLLVRAGQPVDVEAKAFDLLAYLIEQRERVVPAAELLDALWPGTAVTPGAVSRAVHKARTAVGDDGEAQRVIATVHGRGFRFVAPLHAAAPAPSSDLRGGPDLVQLERTLERTATAKTSYAKTGGVHIAYRVFGDGPRDIVLIPGTISHVELFWEFPTNEYLLKRLASFARVIVFDKRGQGLSDRVGQQTLEERTGDVLAVMDAAGSERATIYGWSEGGPMSLMFAASHPERTSALVLYGTYASIRAEPWSLPPERYERFVSAMEQGWGQGILVPFNAPSRVGDEPFVRWWGQLERASASPGAIGALLRANYEIDVRSILPTIQVPTLILHREADALAPIAAGRYLAENIPRAKFDVLPGKDHLLQAFEKEILDRLIDGIEAFVKATTGESPESDRVIATLMFIDIVGSTERAVALGDRRWHQLRSDFYAAVRRELTASRGREVETAGDSLLATFDGPARAIRCVVSIGERVRELGLQIRTGLHTGECERIGNRVSGIAVHIAARITAEARPGEVLVSSTVKDLVAGSQLRFADRGTHRLKGLPDEWRLYAVQDPRADAPSQELPQTPQRSGEAAMCSIAVLPFASLSSDEATSIFSTGLVEEILDHLARAEHYRLYSRRWTLKVASRTASARFAGAGEDIQAVARALGVGYLLEGSVRRIGGHVRVTAQLIRGEDGFHVWSKSYDRPVADGLGTQTHLARNIAHLATAELFFDLWEPWALAGNAGFAGVAPDAVKRFIEAEYQYRQIRLGEGGDWALYEKLLKKAVEADPGFAVGHAILAFTYMKRVGGELPLRTARAAARASIEKAIELAPGEPLTLWQLGEIQMNLELDYAQAQTTFENVLKRHPDRIWIHYNLAAIAVREGRAREALQRLRTAAALDAGYEHAAFMNSYAWLLNVLGHFEQSLRISNEGLDLAFGGPERATNLRNQAHALIGLGRVGEAGPLVAESWELSGPLTPEPHAYLWVKIGENERARRIVDEARGESVDRHALALGHLALGDVDDAFAAIDAGIEDHDPLLVDSLRSAEWWSGIRGDERYRKVIELLEAEETHTAQYGAARGGQRLPQ